MPIDRSKHKERKKTTFSPLDEYEVPAQEHGQEYSASSADSRSSTNSDILREIAESIRNFRVDFEQYKKDNDARAKTFEEKLDDLSSMGNKSPPPNTASQSGPSQNGAPQDANSSASNAPNVTPMQGTPQAQFAQNQGHHFTRQNNPPGTGPTMNYGSSAQQNSFPPSQNNPFGTTTQNSNHPFTFSTPFGTNSNPYVQNFTTPQNTNRNNTVPPVHPFAQTASTAAPSSAPPLQRNLRPNNFNHPSGIVIFDRSTWANSTKQSTCADERFETVHAWYDDIRGGMSAATGHKNVLPELDVLPSTYDFQQAILPPRIQTTYNWAKEEYDSMSSALRVYFFRANTFNDKCCKMLLQRKMHSSTTCGFSLLLKLLGAIFPHMGCMPYDVNIKIAEMTIKQNETYDSFYERFLDIEKEVELSLHRVSNTVVVDKFLSLLMTLPDVIPRLSTIYAELKSHIKKNGPNVDFRYSIHEIYEYLVCSGIVTSSEIQVSPSSLPSGPQAYAAIASTDKVKLLPNDESRATDKLIPRTNRCPICYLRHDANRCWVRGIKWMPIWLKRNVAKYNTLHPNDQPDSKIINADPPLRQATAKSFNAETKQAIFSFSDSDQVVDVANFEEFATSFGDPEISGSPTPNDSSTPTTASSPGTSSTIQASNIDNNAPESTATEKNAVTPAIAPEDIDDLDDNGVDKLLRECFHCGMADYTAKPVGNPFSDHILSDDSNPLVEY